LYFEPWALQRKSLAAKATRDPSGRKANTVPDKASVSTPITKHNPWARCSDPEQLYILTPTAREFLLAFCVFAAVFTWANPQ